MAHTHREFARHIQNFSEASSLEPHWGYVDRAVPCTNDAGSCAYLDLVYASHDRGMVYAGIFWLTILGVALIWSVVRRSSNRPGILPTSTLSRFTQSISAMLRNRLLPECLPRIFGHISSYQLAILAGLIGYLTLFTFLGMTYQTWITPIKNKPGLYNIRTTLGPWSDRIGLLAYALTPLSILLSSRESLLSALTGAPYQSFNFLHRSLGYIIFAQSALHTIGWCVVEIRLYQPQPSTAVDWIRQTYIVWGVVAMILLLTLVLLSTPWGIRATGYEFFRKAHYVLAMVYIGACWAHWANLKCFLLPSLLLWFIDRALRLARSALLHYHILDDGDFAFRAASVKLTLFPAAAAAAEGEDSAVVRLDFANDQDPWRIGQHYFLTFPALSIWQSHPFTPLSLPAVCDAGRAKHAYIVRAKRGETANLATLAASVSHTPVILSGAYGDDVTRHISRETNLLCVAGGTGISYVLPLLLHAARRDQRAELIWAVRHARDTAWVASELRTLEALVTVRIFATRDAHTAPHNTHKSLEKDAPTEVHEIQSATSSSSLELDTRTGRPDLATVVPTFVTDHAGGKGATAVFASGPAGMIGDLRAAVARCNSGARVWRTGGGNVTLVCDNRLDS